MRFGYHTKRPIPAAKNVKLEEVPKGQKAIAESDFLSLFVGSSVITDRDLVNDGAEFCNLGGHFDLYAEPAGLDDHVPNYVAAKCFVAGFDIGHVQIGQNVRNHRQDAICHEMVEVQHASRAPHQETRTVDDIGVAFKNRLDDVNDLRRIVFEVGVLNDDDLASAFLESLLERGAFAAVFLMKDANAIVPSGICIEDLSRAVR